MSGDELLFVDRGVVGTLNEVDRRQAIALVVVPLARVGDDPVICRQQVPTPLPRVVFEHYVLHIGVDDKAPPQESRAEI